MSEYYVNNIDPVTAYFFGIDTRPWANTADIGLYLSHPILILMHFV